MLAYTVLKDGTAYTLQANNSTLAERTATVSEIAGRALRQLAQEGLKVAIDVRDVLTPEQVGQLDAICGALMDRLTSVRT